MYTIKTANVTIMVKDMDKSIDFYTKGLGLELKQRWNNHYAQVSSPGVVIGLHPAKESNNELWILFQDLSKAYDRVNIKMLTKAMERLKLPSSFIQLIANLFTDRENEVFTAIGTTPFYKVLTGIDQGEVMSPLLWCIYLDPLLCEIQQRDLGYHL